jgi:hypothetical protein
MRHLQFEWEKLGARMYIGILPLHCVLLKAAKLRAGINKKSTADFLRESVWGEAGFEVYCITKNLLVVYA